MTPDDREQLRVAVAEAMGYEWWEFEALNGQRFQQLVEPKATWPPRQGGKRCSRPADWIKDIGSAPALTLDWLAEARKTLTEEERHAYAVLLALKFSPHGWNDWRDTWSVIDAPVETHAIVLLKAKGITHPTANRI